LQRENLSWPVLKIKTPARLGDAMMNTVAIEVVSDFTCPWCYMGKRRLEGAIARRPEFDIDVTWQPFQLNPDTPRAGRDRAQHYREKFGADQSRLKIANMKMAGIEDGIDFTNKPGARSPNVLAAHSLMLLARDDEAVNQSELAEKLFYAHHVECEDIGDLDVLARIAGEVGMNADRVRARLTSRDLEPEITATIQESYERGVDGVPFFIINGRYGISGAQPTATLVAAFDQIATDTVS